MEPFAHFEHFWCNLCTLTSTKIFIKFLSLKACQIQSYSLPPNVLRAVFLPEAQLGVHELLGSCHLIVTDCWRNMNLTQQSSIFSGWVFLHSEKVLCQFNHSASCSPGRDPEVEVAALSGLEFSTQGFNPQQLILKLALGWDVGNFNHPALSL